MCARRRGHPHDLAVHAERRSQPVLSWSRQVRRPEESWIRREVPALRIIDHDLATRVDERLGDRRKRYLAAKARNDGTAAHKSHGRNLLSGGMLPCPTRGGHFEARKYPLAGEGTGRPPSVHRRDGRSRSSWRQDGTPVSWDGAVEATVIVAIASRQTHRRLVIRVSPPLRIVGGGIDAVTPAASIAFDPLIRVRDAGNGTWCPSVLFPARELSPLSSRAGQQRARPVRRRQRGAAVCGRAG